MKHKCKDCDYWKKGHRLGECRKKAPVVITDGYETGSCLTTAWPETEATDGCAEIKLIS